MNDYKDYSFIIKPTGPIGTPWQSDTIFGHLSWIVSLQEGSDAVKDFLKPFMNGKPPFILSDGFPGEQLPVPLIKRDSSDSEIATLEDHNQLKKIKKAFFLSPGGFEKSRKEGYVSTGLSEENPYKTTETLHSSINRLTNTTDGEGQLFSTVDTFLLKNETLTIYVRCRDNWIDKLKELMGHLSHLGYGRDKSTGIGAFQINIVEEYHGFSSFEQANGFISLSSFVPAENDPTNGKWRIRVKRGFLGEQAGNGNPFKRPLIQFEPGAVFKTDTSPKPWYGRIVTGIAPGMPEAVQNCMTLAVPCRL